MPVIQIDLHGNIPSKKNSRINTSSGRSFPSKSYTEWHKTASQQVLGLNVKPQVPIVQTVCITIDIRFPTLGRADLSNKAESIMDLLVDLGVIHDDCWTVVPCLLLRGSKNRENPGAYINIEY